jgi:hypothetical protein
VARLKRTLATLDGLDDALKAHYVKRGDTYHLDCEPDEDTTALKTALETERNDVKGLRAKLGEFDGIEPTKAREVLGLESDLRAEREKFDKRKKDDKETDDRLAQLETKHAGEISKREAEITRQRGLTEQYVVESTALAAIAAAGGKTKWLLPHVKPMLRAVEHDGKLVVRVFEGDKELISRVAGRNGPMDAEELVSSFKANEEWADAFSGTGASGGGMPHGGANGAGRAGTVAYKSDLKTNAEKSAYISEHGLPAWEGLPGSPPRNNAQG